MIRARSKENYAKQEEVTWVSSQTESSCERNWSGSNFEQKVSREWSERKWIHGPDVVCSESREALYHSGISSGQLAGFSDRKSVVEGGIYYMALLIAISLRNEPLPGFTISTFGKPYKLPLISRTHTAHITVQFPLFQDSRGLPFNG